MDNRQVLEKVKLIDANLAVSGILLLPSNPTACYVFAQGAGAGMEHRFMADAAEGLATKGIATLRYHSLTWKPAAYALIDLRWRTPQYVRQWQLPPSGFPGSR